MAFPIDALGPDVRALFAHIECPICLDLQSDLQILCDGGHSVCSVCYDGMMRSQYLNGRKCPTCRKPVSQPRPNTAVNALVQALNIPPRTPAAPAIAAPVGRAERSPIAAPQAPVIAPVAPVAAPINRITDKSRLKRSIVGKLRTRITKLNQIRHSLGGGRSAYYSRRWIAILNEMRHFGREWRAEALGVCRVDLFQNGPATAREAFFGNA